MAVDRTYRCDLCRDMHDANSGKLVGIFWKANTTLELARVREVEHHLCRRCVEQVSNLRSLAAYSE